MTHEQISALVQINQSLGEIRANAAIAMDEAKKAIDRINDVVARIESEQNKIAVLLK